MATSKFSQVDEYGFVRPNDFDYGTYEVFMSKYLKVLAVRAKKWTKLIQEGKSISRSRILKRYIRKGIPNEYRGQIWSNVSGVEDIKLQFGHDLFQRLLEGPHNQEIVDSINTDIPRTFPDNIFFSNVHEERPLQLYRILLAYAHHNRKVGYCQGLNYIAGLLLLVTKNEETVFWLLKVLVERLLPDYYSRTMDGVITDIDVLSELVRFRLPDLHLHIKSLGFPWAVIATKWLICLYVDVLPVETVLRIWDCFFYEGSKILFRVAITLISKHNQTLLHCDDFGKMAECFKEIIKDYFTLHCHDFLQSIFKTPGSLKMITIDNLRTKITEERRVKEKSKNKPIR